MIPESRPLQRPPEARLLAIDAAGRMRQVPRADFVAMVRRGDLVIANDAATLPASLHGNHVGAGAPIELRLAGWPSAMLDDPRRPLCSRGIALLSVRSRRGLTRCSATRG